LAMSIRTFLQVPGPIVLRQPQAFSPTTKRLSLSSPSGSPAWSRRW
jgi:hypothetical protein